VLSRVWDSRDSLTLTREMGTDQDLRHKNSGLPSTAPVGVNRLHKANIRFTLYPATSCL
jgi:hypothetical protein